MTLPPPNVRFMNYESAIEYLAKQVDEETIERRRKAFDHMLRLTGLRGEFGQYMPDDGFLLGIPKMDDDHRNMIELINRLDDQLQSAQHQTTIIDTFEELYSSSAKHFAYEEAIMRQRGDEEHEEHKADHRRLLDRVTICKSDYQCERMDNGVPKGLANWLWNHIQSHDARLHLPNDPVWPQDTTSIV